mgnify:CR=1 FL=1
MDRETLNRRINAGNFVETNGSIMRTLNILATKYSRLKDIRYAISGVSKTEIETSINYLCEAGYLHLREIDSRQATTLADAEFEKLEAKLTSRGIQLLAGVIKDECVEV